MKVNIKDDPNGPKKDSEKLATIKKSEKAGDLKISEAKKFVISKAIVDATNQTPAAASSASNENLFSEFLSSVKDVTPSSSTFSSVTFIKDPVLLSSPSAFCHQPFVFGKQTLVPGPLQNKQESTTIVKPSILNSLVLPPKINTPQTATSVSMKENTALKDSVSNQQSSSIDKSIHNSLAVPDIMNSVQTIAGAQAMTTTCNDSLNNLQSLTPVSPFSKLQSSTPVKASTQNRLSQATVDTQPMKEKTIILDDSLSNLLSSSTVKPSMQNSLVSNTTNLAQSLSDVQPMEENGTFDDLLLNQECLNTVTTSVQNNSSSSGVNSEQYEFPQLIVEKNTKQVSMPPIQPSVENVNSSNSSHVQRFSVPIPVLGQTCHSNIQKAYNILKKLQYSLQYSMSTQAQVSNTTLSVSMDKNILPSQNSSTKGVKRKAEETKSMVKNSGSLGNSVCLGNSGSSENSGNSGKPGKSGKPENSGKPEKSGNSGNSGKSGNLGNSEKKKNKRKQKFVQAQIVKKKIYNSQNNFSEMKNSNALTCAIVEEQYPNMPPLTNVHLGIIRNMIKERIDNIPFGVFVPKFLNAFIKDGVILVECADNNSKDWLKHAVTNYNPQEGVYLKVIPPDAINEYYPASIFVHDEENAIEVLRRLQKQNSDVSVQNWQYLSMIIVKESTPGITINVGIPATSVAQLKEKNFKLFHAMDQVMVVMNVAIPF